MRNKKNLTSYKGPGRHWTITTNKYHHTKQKNYLIIETKQPGNYFLSNLFTLWLVQYDAILKNIRNSKQIIHKFISSQNYSHYETFEESYRLQHNQETPRRHLTITTNPFRRETKKVNQQKNSISLGQMINKQDDKIKP